MPKTKTYQGRDASIAYRAYKAARRGGASGSAAGRSAAFSVARARAVQAPSRQLRIGEKKGVDTDVSQSNIIATTNTNGAAFVLNLIQPGNGSWNRVGRKTYLQSVRLKLRALHQSIGNTTGPVALNGNVLRVVLVWDKQPSSGTIPTWDTIFGITAQDGTESSSVFSPLRYDNMDRFQVLKDCIIEDNPQAAVSAAQVNQWHDLDEFVRLGQKECVYSGQSTPQTIADISTGALYLYYRANEFSDGVNEWNVNGLARLRYTD